jgi:hypothetical protein
LKAVPPVARGLGNLRSDDPRGAKRQAEKGQAHHGLKWGAGCGGRAICTFVQTSFRPALRRAGSHNIERPGHAEGGVSCATAVIPATTQPVVAVRAMSRETRAGAPPARTSTPDADAPLTRRRTSSCRTPSPDQLTQKRACRRGRGAGRVRLLLVSDIVGLGIGVGSSDRSHPHGACLPHCLL